MKKLLLIALLVVGCDELTLNNNKISDGTAVTDTLYIFNYDTLIVTNYDTTIVYDTTFAIDTIYIETDNDEIFDVDWILVKNPEYVEEVEEDGAIIELVTYSGIGYTFLGTNSISNHSLNSISSHGSDGMLYFEYESELYSFDLSDSYNEEAEEYFITANDSPYDVVNIYCYDNMSYCHIVQNDGLAYVLDLTSPFEVIDYR